MSASRAAFARQYLLDLGTLLEKLPIDPLATLLELLDDALARQCQVFLAGNGGSASTASHMANDLMKTVAKKHGKGLRAISLSDNAEIVTAIANDHGYEHIFSQQLSVLAHAGDVLILISGSGNSKNLLEAASLARTLKVMTIGFLGMDGGKLKSLVDVPIIVPAHDYGPIEDVHVIFNHLVTAYLQKNG